jgi:hypothetical protein
MMKNWGMLGLLTLMMTASARAEDCKANAISVAKMNLDQVAKQYGFETSDIAGGALIRTMKVKVTKTVSEKLSIYRVSGSIYKASYSVTVALDDSCAVRSVNIHDDASL